MQELDILKQTYFEWRDMKDNVNIPFCKWLTKMYPKAQTQAEFISMFSHFELVFF